MALELVSVNGQRTSAGAAAALSKLKAAFRSRWGLDLILSSGYRSNAEQRAIFLDRYRVQASGNGPYNDVRWWEGRRYVRVSGAGTVAVPGTSRHEKASAVDLRDSGRDAGVTVKGTPRANWLRAEAPKYGFQPTGYGFGEPWHYDYTGSHEAPAGGGGSTPPSAKKEIKVEHYQREDGKAFRAGGLDLKPGSVTWLHTDPKKASSQASNIVGGVGEYSFVEHVYAEGTPGDVVDLVLAWDDVNTSGPHSMHFVERIEIGADGFARRNVPFARRVTRGYAVYARLSAPASNKDSVKITRFYSDALLFTVA